MSAILLQWAVARSIGTMPGGAVAGTVVEAGSDVGLAAAAKVADGAWLGGPEVADGAWLGAPEIADGAWLGAVALHATLAVAIVPTRIARTKCRAISSSPRSGWRRSSRV